MFIVIEGADATGKQTQSEMLVAELIRKGVDAERISFPDYGSEYGKMISGYLKTGRHPPEEAILLYLLDMYSKKKQIQQKAEHKTLVCDRYWYSNLAYQTARKGGKNLEQWIKDCASRLPVPDHVFLLNMPAKVSEMLMRDREKDLHELDIRYQDKVRQNYLRIARDLGWNIVECVRQGALRSPEDILAEIMGVLNR